MNPSSAGGRPAGTAPSHLLYLHGFRSSPNSAKARQCADWVQRQRPELHWWCPQLPASPREAIELLERGCTDWPRQHTAVIGSSLGGFYATVLAERWGCPAVLLNPAVHPARDLAAHIGESRAWHGDEPFFFRPEFIGELQALTPATITRPQRYFALIAEGDEVLDWREMRDRYAGCPQRLIAAGVAGSDHALSRFEAQLPEVLDFLGLGTP